MAESETEPLESPPEGAGIRPEAHELGPYAQFVIEQRDLPKLYREYNRVDFLHWLNRPPSKSLWTGLSNWWYNTKIGWWGGKNTLLDIVVPHLPTNLLLVGLVQLLIISAGLLLNYDSRTNVWEAVLASSDSLAVAFTGVGVADYRFLSDKRRYRKKIRKENNLVVRGCIWDREPGQEVVWGKAFSHLSGLIATGRTDFPKFEDIDGEKVNEIAEQHRYELAVLRSNSLWDNPAKKAAYADWLNLGEDALKDEEQRDKELTTALQRHIEAEALEDLERGLSKVMSEDDSKEYLPTLVDIKDEVSRPLFWLSREVKQKNGNDDEYAKSGFLEWVDEVSRGLGVHYLVSEAAKGKTTVLNLLTIHHLSTDESGIWPIRIKLRKFDSKSKDNLNLLGRIRANYVSASEGRPNSETIGARFDLAIKGGDSDDRPLLILDGLDELEDAAQNELLEELNNSRLDMPIIVATRPIPAISEKKRAVLGKMTGRQRTEVLRNLTLDPQQLARVEKLLPTSLIDRPFALLIAARELKKAEASVDDPDVNLSLSKVCSIYEKEYFEREVNKKSEYAARIKDHRGFLPRLKEALSDLALDQLRGNQNSSDPHEMLIHAEKLNIIYSNNRLIDTWLEGYYASRSENLCREDWDLLLERVSSEPDQNELIVRHFIARTEPSQTPDWNELESNAPVVMDIASQEWLAMDRINRESMMKRMGIPSDGDGRLAFGGNGDFLKCELPVLLSLMHFHCSIAKSKRWYSDKVEDDPEWEDLFSAIASRYYSEFKVIHGIIEGQIRGHKFAEGEQLGENVKNQKAFLEKLSVHDKEFRAIERVTKLVPYDRHTSMFKSLYSNNATPSPLLGLIEKSLGKSVGGELDGSPVEEDSEEPREPEPEEEPTDDLEFDELESFIFSVGMIEVHAQRTLFKLQRSVLEEHVPSAYKITGRSWERARILLHRIIGVRNRKNQYHIGKLENMKLSPSRFGIPLEIKSEGGLVEARELHSEDEFEPLFFRGSPFDYSRSRILDQDLKTIPRSEPRKRERPAIGTEISINEFSPLIIPENISNSRLVKILPSKGPQVGAVAKFIYNIEHWERERIIGKINDGRDAYIQGILVEDEELDLESASEKWEVDEVRKRITAGMKEAWLDKEHQYLIANLPSEHSRLRRLSTLHRNQFIIPRLDLEPAIPVPGDYLISFKPELASDSPKPGSAISLSFQRNIINWFIGTRQSKSKYYDSRDNDLPKANEELGRIYYDFLDIENKRFHPTSHFEEIDQRLGGLREVGKVAVYLNSSDRQMRHDRQYRILIVPGTTWFDRKFSDLSFQMGGDIEKAFSDIFSVIREAPRNSHLNRWYSVNFSLVSDDIGYRYFHPDSKSIELLCQLCAVEVVEVEEGVDQKFVCHKCRAWATGRPWF